MLEELHNCLTYIENTPLKEIDLDILFEIIEQYNTLYIDPNDECPLESSILGDIEVAFFNAECAQIDED